MASNEKIIIERYADPSREELRATRSRGDGIEFLYTKKIIEEYVTPRSAVIELGCGTGYYGMFLADKCASYHGVDITPNNIAAFQEKIDKNHLTNVTAAVGDATKLAGAEDSRYDLVLVLGPIYHLPTPEKELVFTESRRVCKAGGVILYAYINKIGPYIGACIAAPDRYPNQAANDLILNRGVDDIRPEIYFYIMPEEMEAMARRHQLRVVKNLGLNFLQNAGLVNNMSDEQYEAWLALSDFMQNSPSCTAFSCHALLVCEKE